MIPLKLALRNFMCYRENVPTLDLRGVHTTSICGDNGNGKSALIDAMTWALWGKTRARSDDDLIAANQGEMQVEFDFAVGEQLYRIIRKHARPRRKSASGQSSLDLLISSGEDFRVISANTIAQTQQEIIKVLHMEYATFINSALLLQGRADEFTVANPARRKQVLADILGLSYYDELEERAKEQVRRLDSEKTQLTSTIRELSEELARRPAYQAELEQAEKGLAQVEKVLAEQEAKLTELRQKREALRNKESQLAQLERHAEEMNRTLRQWEEHIQQHRARLKEYEDLIARREDIMDGYARYLTARKLDETLQHRLLQSSKLQRRQHELEMFIYKATQELVKEHDLVHGRVVELEGKAGKIAGLREELAQAQGELRRLSGEEDSLQKKRQAGQELRSGFCYMHSNILRLEKEITQIDEKLALVASGSTTSCPLCETDLGTDGVKLIESKYITEKGEKSEALKTSQSDFAARKVVVKAAEAEVARLEAKLKQERPAVQGRLSLAERAVAEAEKAGEELASEKEKLADIEERMARKDFAVSEQETLRCINAELCTVGYDGQEHEQVRKSVAELERYDEPKRRLEEAEKSIDQQRETLARAEQASEQVHQGLEADSQQRKELAAELAGLEQVVSELGRAETACNSLRAEQKGARERVGSIKGQLEHCATLELRKKEKEETLSRVEKETSIYTDLAAAFGKRGIQALLIESAVPELEIEANKLLARMTDNRMSVKIETQRETKKGDVVETLDINISDEMGTRNYEMFSGGEAFRINFAIRIALSRLLARRAGAPLPTLIIDEGFGTQDSTGLEKLKEAITTIQDDFEKILVITHVEELRDAFPSRIDVVKTSEGSTILLG